MTLSPDELAERDGLGRSNVNRINNLAQKNMQPQGIREHYMTAMLEYLVGDELDKIKLEHERWCAVQLDELERKIRHAVLLQPPNGAKP